MMWLNSLQNSSWGPSSGLHLYLQISHGAQNRAEANLSAECGFSTLGSSLAPLSNYLLQSQEETRITQLPAISSLHPQKNWAASPAHSPLIRIITCFSLKSDLATFSEISKLPDVVWFLLGCRFSQSMWLCHETSQFTIQILRRTKIRSFTSVSIG